jgi:hypothetical protein
MPGSKGDYLETRILDHVLGGPDFVRPATMYLALFVASPTDAGGGSEVSAGGYARVAVLNNTANWPAASGTAATKTNGAPFTFPTATAGWGTVNSFALFDSASAGNLLYWGPLVLPKVVGAGDTLAFGVGSISITED